MAEAVKGRILIIDDEHVIADTLALIFSNAGYDARAAYSAESALSWLDMQQWVPQIAVIDVVLPGMNGIDLAILLAAKHPDMHTALFSGQAATSDFMEAARLKGHPFDVLAKPVHPTALLGMASSLLSGNSGGTVQTV